MHKLINNSNKLNINSYNNSCNTNKKAKRYERARACVRVRLRLEMRLCKFYRDVLLLFLA